MKTGEELIRLLLAGKGLSYTDVDHIGGLPAGTAREAARRPHFAGELAIAEAVSMSPRQIWPRRYEASGGAYSKHRGEMDMSPKDTSPEEGLPAANAAIGRVLRDPAASHWFARDPGGSARP